MLTVMDPVAVFPAMSVACPETFWLWPSLATVCWPEQLATPDRLSTQLKLTVTLLLFHPAPLGAGAAVAVMVGGVLSMLKTVLTGVVFPAWSVACATIFCFAPSVETVAGEGH